jgi:hypothetical protein
MDGPLPRASDRRPELPQAFDRVLAVGMAKDPDRRYPSCGELAAAALAALSGLEPALPAGARTEGLLRTFMVADIRGYTRYTQLHGDEAAGQIAGTFAALVDEVVREHGGTLQELRGDEALTVFESPRSALRTAVELQRRIAAGELELRSGSGSTPAKPSRSPAAIEAEPSTWLPASARWPGQARCSRATGSCTSPARPRAFATATAGWSA